MAPIALAFQSAKITCPSVAPISSATETSDPGTTPEAPAVGAATMTPMVAERSSTAIAYATARVCVVPISALEIAAGVFATVLA